MNDLGRQPLSGDPAARVLVAGASGFTGALAAQIVWRHPRLQLVAVTSRSDAGTRLDSLYPRYRVPLELTELDLDRLDGIDAAIVAYPHGAAAPTVAALRAQGVLVVDLSADFRLRDMETYERWYGEHGAPELFGTGVYGLTEMYREELREAKLVATPGCYPTASVLGAGAAGRKGPARRRRHQRHAGRLRRRPRRRRRVHYARWTRTPSPTRPRATATGPRSSRSWRRSAVRRRSPSSRTCCRSTRASWPAATRRLTEPISKEAVQALYRERYADEPFVHVVDGPPGLRDAARHATSATSTSPSRSAAG